MIITEIFEKVFNMSLAAAVVILAVILLRLVLKRAPKIFSYLLWTAVIFRLLCPFTPVLPFAPLRSDMVSFENFKTDYTEEIPQVSNVTEQIHEPAETTNYTNENTFPITSENIPKEVPDRQENEKEPFVFDMLLCASFVWIFGVIAMALWGIISYVRLGKSLKNSERLRENIYLAKTVNNAFILGSFRPKIFIPADISEKEREFIIIHEKTHLRRGDHLAKLIMYIALCVHWFDPLVWLSFALFEKDMEMSCDEAAAKNFSRQEKADYSQALLNVSSKRAAAFTACFGESSAKSRIKNILSFKKPAVWVIILCTTVAALSVVFLVTDRAETLPDEKLETAENTEFISETQNREQPENIEFTEMQIQLPDEVTSVSEKITGFDYSHFTENSSDSIQLIAAAENEIPSENIPLSAPDYEYKNSVYFGSEFPVILYANEKYCVFKDGFDGIYIYDFDDEELVFEAILSEDTSFIGAASDNNFPVLYFNKNNSVYCLNTEENRLEKFPDGTIDLPMLKGVVYLPEINLNAVLIDGSENGYIYWETSGYAGVHSIKLIKHTESGEREFIPIKMVYCSDDEQFLSLEYGGGEFTLYSPLSSNTGDRQIGTYKYADGENAIIFTAENGDVFKFAIKGDSLIYDENGSAQTRWDGDNPFGTLTDDMIFEQY